MSGDCCSIHRILDIDRRKGIGYKPGSVQLRFSPLHHSKVEPIGSRAGHENNYPLEEFVKGGLSCRNAIDCRRGGACANRRGKIPREVIDEASARGTVLVLVGLNVPWQMESRLNEDEVRAQREAIASVQRDLLSELEGRNY